MVYSISANRNTDGHGKLDLGGKGGPKNQSVKRLLILLLVLVTAAAVVFLLVFLLAKQKKIFLNKWFVDESRSIIGADISAYQADVDMARRLRRMGALSETEMEHKKQPEQIHDLLRLRACLPSV